MASRGSKIALAGTSLFAVTTIVFVHFQQQAEKSVRSLGLLSPLSHSLAIVSLLSSCRLFLFPSRKSGTLLLTVPSAIQAMHQGVVRDMEQQRIKRERQLDFDLQRQLEAEYKQEQSVRSSIEGIDGIKR